MRVIRSPKILLILLCLAFFVPGVCFAGLSGLGLTSELTVDAGLRNDQLDWNIAGVSPVSLNYVNVLSELTWDDVQIFQFRVHGGLDLAVEGKDWLRPHLRGMIGYGEIYSGQNQDSDYDGDNRTLEYSRSNNSADQGDVLDLSLALGQRFSFHNERLVLTPLVGYSYLTQNLKLLDGYQTIPATGPFADLDSSYDTEWWGPWLGLELQWAPSAKFRLKGLTEYHQVEFFATANWNLRAEFAHPVSFEHHADGRGWVNEIGLELFLRDNWSLELSGTLQSWQTDAGYDLVFLADGTRQVTRLNQVNWESRSIQLGLSYRF